MRWRKKEQQLLPDETKRYKVRPSTPGHRVGSPSRMLSAIEPARYKVDSPRAAARVTSRRPPYSDVKVAKRANRVWARGDRKRALHDGHRPHLVCVRGYIG
jgi:hypothetical protein